MELVDIYDLVYTLNENVVSVQETLQLIIFLLLTFLVLSIFKHLYNLFGSLFI